MSPSFWLKLDDYKRLGVSVPKKDASVVGLLFGREKDHYCSDWNYVLAIAKTGARIMFLDYEHHRAQLADCDALVLPGGAFASPEKFYTDGKTERLSCPTQRSEANAHRIWVVPDTPFAELMGKPESMMVNSRHNEFLAPERVQREELHLCNGDKLPFDIYATATDGIPEAWEI